MKRPFPAAASGVHEKVMEICKGFAPGNVLDAPAGPGALSERLAEIGFKVSAFDIDETSFAAVNRNIVFTKGDLNLGLPYPELSFEGVVCVEGVEHLENIHDLLSRFARVLVPEGKLVITTPNTTNLYSRIKFLFFGSLRYFNSRIEIADRSLSGHIHPIGFSELEYALTRAGFTIRQITTNTDMNRWRSLRAACAALCRWVNMRFNKAYNPVLCSPELLFGDVLIIGAQKIR